MDLVIHRTYFEEGTNGVLFINGSFFGFTIELPWQDNTKNLSCIPEGIYEVKPRYSKRFKHHLQLIDVPNRSLILLHGGNDAKRDLRGCIAPVTQLTGLGKGLQSQPLLQQLVSLCYQSHDLNIPVLITIKS
ncbi:DUF5675 family protein [Aestuariibaculum sp. M13]|uniref:DUF5675 family protein n=1 Tax=Aestuariibaculum sp. M13 TaxID=2967132 RepID=UPI002159E18B|nr:DUF5675 family protein [Aestuariibaculum sp. M13]MCR8666193.1 DUF5675 family protein [Aestuariibaculum sp. M13]